MKSMNRRTPCVLCAVVLAAAAALTPAQAPAQAPAQEPSQSKSHDALARPRAKAAAQNQRVLLMLTGGDANVGAALTAALRDYRGVGKLLRYEYQLAALPSASLPGTALRNRLGLRELALPALAAANTKDEVLGTLSATQMVEGGVFDQDRVRGFLEQHACAPLDANKVLADGLALAKATGRHALVYLSAPW